MKIEKTKLSIPVSHDLTIEKSLKNVKLSSDEESLIQKLESSVEGNGPLTTEEATIAFSALDSQAIALGENHSDIKVLYEQAKIDFDPRNTGDSNTRSRSACRTLGFIKKTKKTQKYEYEKLIQDHATIVSQLYQTREIILTRWDGKRHVVDCWDILPALPRPGDKKLDRKVKHFIVEQLTIVHGFPNTDACLKALNELGLGADNYLPYRKNYP